jgi:serine/threonine protein kinase/tetratricopeptide (TPR) repeat protein
MTEQDIYVEAMNRLDTAERGRFLDEACGQNHDLRARLEKLVERSDQVAEFLERPPAPLMMTADAAVDPVVIGTQIGPYRICDPIGEGGFGVVFLAEQSAPVRRKVALKVIKPGMDTRQVIGRFEAERQALAMMDHPNIAKVHDAGATENGRPYFVMELVRGVPITDYCDQSNLTTRDRLKLFVTVCQAVQHAHQKGVIHRDIKPTNVLVSMQDGQPTPKIIDFGVAKAIGEQPLTERTLTTEFAQMVGTPLYMSPEQAQLSSLGVDTRSDIYSLGVLLYELLTGTTPFDKDRLHSASYDELRRIIREEEPQHPSARISTLAANRATTIAEHRRTDTRRLMQTVRGELDWIVMKCLEKDRNRRYETPNSLAGDIERYLHDESVQACPPSAAYRLRKFVRRNKGPVLAVSLVLLTLAAGIIGTTLGMVESRRRAEGERLAKERAEANFALANEAVEKYLGTVTNDPDLERSDFQRLRKNLLESALPFFQKLASQKSDDPAVEAGRGRAYARLGSVRRALGENEAAVRDFEAEREIFARLSAKFPANRSYAQRLAESLEALGAALHHLGKRVEGEAAYREGQGIVEKLVADFPTVPTYRRNLASSLNGRGNLLAELGKHQDAEPLHRKAVAIGETLVAEFPDEPAYRLGLAASHQNLGLELQELGKRGDAEEAFRKAIALQAQLVSEFADEPEHRHSLAVTYNNLATLLRPVIAKRGEAAELFRQAIAIREKLTIDFPTVPGYRRSLAGTQINLALLLEALEKRDEAEARYRQAIAIQEKLTDEFPTVPVYRHELAGCYNNLGNLLSALGKGPEAEAALRQAIAIQEKLAAEFPGVSAYAVRLGGGYCNFGRRVRDGGQPEAALDWYQKAIATLEPVVAKERRLANAREFLRNSHLSRATALDDLDRRDEATRDWERARELDDGSNAPIFRIRISRNKKDAAGCLAAAAEYESVERTGADSQYAAGCHRAICAAVIPQDSKTRAADAERLAREQSDLAMAWLRKAVAAGFTNAELMKQDKDLDALREREDFQQLLASLEERRQ